MFASRLNVTTLWLDLIYVVAATQCLIAYMQIIPLDLYQNSPIGAQMVPFIVIGTSGLGCHSLLIVVQAVMLTVYVLLCPRSTVDNCVTVPYFTLIMTGLVLLTEYCLATLVVELQAQLVTTQRLLDHATDGFCTLDSTNTITDASPQLAKTFGCNQLQGASLTGFVEDADKHKVEFNWGLGSFDELNLSPVLATCHRKSLSGTLEKFDAQIVPYASRDSNLNILIRVLGEVREYETEQESKGSDISNEQDAAASKTVPAHLTWAEEPLPLHVPAISVQGSVLDDFSELAFSLTTKSTKVFETSNSALHRQTF